MRQIRLFGTGVTYRRFGRGDNSRLFGIRVIYSLATGYTYRKFGTGYN